MVRHEARQKVPDMVQGARERAQIHRHSKTHQSQDPLLKIIDISHTLQVLLPLLHQKQNPKKNPTTAKAAACASDNNDFFLLMAHTYTQSPLFRVDFVLLFFSVLKNVIYFVCDISLLPSLSITL